MAEGDGSPGLAQRLDQVERKVDQIVLKQDHMLEKVQTGFELAASRQDGHWKLVEQQFEMSKRESAQAISFLTEMAKESRARESKLEEVVDGQGSDVIVLKGQMVELDKRITAIAGNLQWIGRTLGAQVVVFIGALVLFFATRS